MAPRNNSMTTSCGGRETTPYRSVAGGFVRGLFELAVAKGANPRELARRCDLEPAELRDPDHRVPFAKYIALMRTAKQLCNDPALALHFGEEVDISQMTVIGFTGGTDGASMDEGIARLNRYAPLAIEVDGASDRFSMERIDGQLWIVDSRPDPNDFPELTESFFARMVCGMRRWFGETPVVLAVHVTHAEPPYLAEYDRIFSMPVVFESDRNALLLSNDAWSTFGTAFSSRYASEVLTAHAEALLTKLESEKTIRGRVEALLMPILHTGHATIDAVAGELGLSRQTLFRKLKAEGVTFEKVLDELRHRMALHYLNAKKASVHETAYLVGFSDPAAFSRAFKRWTGVSPRGLRVSPAAAARATLDDH
jgi:AraC-like DNA-binding protein